MTTREDNTVLSTATAEFLSNIERVQGDMRWNLHVYVLAKEFSEMNSGAAISTNVDFDKSIGRRDCGNMKWICEMPQIGSKWEDGNIGTLLFSYVE